MVLSVQRWIGRRLESVNRPYASRSENYRQGSIMSLDDSGMMLTLFETSTRTSSSLTNGNPVLVTGSMTV